MGKMSDIWEGEVAGHRDEEMGPQGPRNPGTAASRAVFLSMSSERTHRRHVKPASSL